MYVKKLQFQNFRNLENSVIEPINGINVIYGANGAGKTNMIEAIWMLTGRRSFRGVKDQNLIRTVDGKRENTAEISGVFFAGGREQRAVLTLGIKKSAALNSVQLGFAGELSESFKAVVFSPCDLELIDDSPQVRRRWLDGTIGAMRPKYEKVLSAYRKCLDQRNAVLKNYYDDRETAKVLLEVYDRHLSNYGEYLIKQRKLYLKALGELIPPIFDELTASHEKFTLEYECSGEEDNAQGLINALRQSRENDIKYAMTTVGPHRDDVQMNINSMACRTYSSQGQKRSAVLALKICEAQIIRNNTGELPVILLDDVMSELDEHRRDYVINRITGGQVFITCCDRSTVDIQKTGKTFKVSAGVCTEIRPGSEN